jgi:hypothetical protein
MLRDTLVGLIEPMLRRAGVCCSRAGSSPCCSRHRTIDPQCLENPRPAGAESTLTENARSPFHAEPRHGRHRVVWLIKTENLIGWTRLVLRIVWKRQKGEPYPDLAKRRHDNPSTRNEKTASELQVAKDNNWRASRQGQLLPPWPSSVVPDPAHDAPADRRC